MELLLDDVILDNVMPLLSLRDRMSLGRACRRFWGLARASFRGLPLDFPDRTRVADRGLFPDLNGPHLVSAVRFALDKGAWLRCVDDAYLAGRRGATLAQFLGPGQPCLTLQRYEPVQNDLEWQRLLPNPASSIRELNIVQIHEPCDFSVFPNLSSLTLCFAFTKNAGFFAAVMAQVPLTRLSTLQLIIAEHIPPENVGEVRQWLENLPALPLLISFDLLFWRLKTEHLATFALPWEAFPSLQELGAEALSCVTAPARIAHLRRLTWHDSIQLGRPRVPNRPAPELFSILGWASGLRDLRLRLSKSDLHPDLVAALRRLSGLRSLQLELRPEPNYDLERSTWVVLAGDVLGGLPDLRRLRIGGGGTCSLQLALQMALAAPKLRLFELGFLVEMTIHEYHELNKPQDPMDGIEGDIAALVGRAPICISLENEEECDAAKKLTGRIHPKLSQTVWFDWRAMSDKADATPADFATSGENVCKLWLWDLGQSLV